jgi:hypothetical protein
MLHVWHGVAGATSGFIVLQISMQMSASRDHRTRTPWIEACRNCHDIATVTAIEPILLPFDGPWCARKPPRVLTIAIDVDDSFEVWAEFDEPG